MLEACVEILRASVSDALRMTRFGVLLLAELGERVECEIEHWRDPPFAEGAKDGPPLCGDVVSGFELELEDFAGEGGYLLAARR